MTDRLEKSVSSKHSRTVFVHVGTHKTGSTAIQQFLFANAATLASAGVYVPRCGRLAEHAEGCGHHNVAFDLTENPGFHPALGSFDDLLDEIVGCAQSNVCLSSEEFENLHGRPATLTRVRDAFARLGFATTIVIYLRPQVDYLESLYAEIVKAAWFEDFSTCLRNVLADATMTPGGVLFSYERLVGAFTTVFGHDHVIVRPYRRDAPPAYIQLDLARVIGLSRRQRRACIVSADERVNERLSFAATIAVLRGASVGRTFDRARDMVTEGFASELAAIDGPFDPIAPREAVHIVRRFVRQNLALSLRYRAAFGCISGKRLMRSLHGRLHPQRPQRRRRVYLESVLTALRRRKQMHAARSTNLASPE